jgi:hypothetical protein
MDATLLRVHYMLHSIHFDHCLTMIAAALLRVHYTLHFTICCKFQAKIL